MKNIKHQLRNILLSCVGIAAASYGQAQMVTVAVGINQPASLVASAGATATIDMCEGDTIAIGGNPTATGGTSPFVYTWSPGTDLSATTVSNPLAYPGSNITYSLMVTDVNNCSSTATVAVDVNTIPSAAFSAVGTGLTVAFTDQSVGTVTSYAWDFGDGGTSTVASPSHTYANYGTYTVCLTVDNNGCTSTFCDTTDVLVGIAPAAVIPGVQVYPNPYQGETQLHFDMTETAQVKVEAFDVAGKFVGLVADGLRDAGSQTIRFSAADFDKPAGVYLLRLTVGERTMTLRVNEIR